MFRYTLRITRQVVELAAAAHQRLTMVFGIAGIVDNAQMKNWVAWSPLRQPAKIRFVGILCPPGQVICRDTYNSYLGKRVQALIDGSENPEHVARTLKEALHEVGMLGFDGHGPLNEVGNDHVASNPCVWEALTNLRVYDSIWPPRKIPVTDSLLVRRELHGEWSSCDDPEGKLQMWVNGLSQAL